MPLIWDKNKLNNYSQIKMYIYAEPATIRSYHTKEPEMGRTNVNGILYKTANAQLKPGLRKTSRYIP